MTYLIFVWRVCTNDRLIIIKIKASTTNEFAPLIQPCIKFCTKSAKHFTTEQYRSELVYTPSAKYMNRRFRYGIFVAISMIIIHFVASRRHLSDLRLSAILRHQPSHQTVDGRVKQIVLVGIIMVLRVFVATFKSGSPRSKFQI